MILNQELAEKMIIHAKRIIDYPVNIMNTSAIVIASTDINRLNTVHFAAEIVLKTKESFSITEEIAAQHPGYLPGINVPIKFRQEIIGVLGVAAKQESELIGGLLLSSIELLVEQSYLQDEIHLHKQLRTDFLTRLLTDSYHQNESYFLHQFELHQFSVNQQYLVSCLSIPEDFFSNVHKKQKDSNLHHYHEQISSLVEKIETELSQYKPIIIVQPEHLAILIPFFTVKMQKQDLFEKEYIEILKKSTPDFIKKNWKIIIGGIAEDASQIHKCYKHAIYSDLISNSVYPEKKIISFSDCYLEYELLSIPQKKREEFWKTTLSSLIDEKNILWLTTLECFIDHNQNIHDTADALFIHRNTLQFRLQKIRKMTGLNPQNFKDARTLSVALSLWKMNQIDAEIGI